MPSRGFRHAGFVLVGGSSSRMGRDKALIPYAGTTLASQVASRVQAAAGSVTLVGNPDRYRSLPYPVIPDLHPGHGALAGVEAALAASRASWNLIVACDMPALTTAFLRSLLGRAEACGAPCLAPVTPDGLPEPLCAVWRRETLPTIRRLLRRNTVKMLQALEDVGAAYWPVATSAWFENLNTPGDWETHHASIRLRESA